MLLQKEHPAGGPGVHTSKHAKSDISKQAKARVPQYPYNQSVKKLGYDTSRHRLYKQVGDQQRQKGRYRPHECHDEYTVAAVGLSAL
jgi:hypothetical protein